LNLRKPPTLLKDGDWIGWGNADDIKHFKDDLQTEEDLSVIFIFYFSFDSSRKAIRTQ
jgi:hypothetical protein